MKFGVVLPHVSSFMQLPYIVIHQLNRLSQSGYDPAVFFFDHVPIHLRPLFGCFNITELYNYDGPITATSLESAQYILTNKKSRKKYFYVWELEFLKKFNWIENLKIYQDPQLTLISPSEDYRKELKNYCNRDSLVIPDFKVETWIAK